MELFATTNGSRRKIKFWRAFCRLFCGHFCGGKVRSGSDIFYKFEFVFLFVQEFSCCFTQKNRLLLGNKVGKMGVRVSRTQKLLAIES